MKKTLVSIIAGLTVAGAAFAAPTPDAVKDMCLKHPDKYVWVEKTQACVPINPCLSDDSDIKTAYCDNRTFSRISLSNGHADMVVGLAPLYKIALLGGAMPGVNVKYSEPDPNYVAEYDLDRGTYKVYKFANANLDRSSAFEFLMGVCNAVGGANTGTTYYNDDGFAAIDCKSSAQKVYKLLEQSMDFMFNFKIDYVGNTITFSFKSESACYAFDNCMNK